MAKPLPLSDVAIAGDKVPTQDWYDFFREFHRLSGTAVVTVATLPSAGIAGRRYLVTDATATTFGTIAAGGGINRVPVYDDGINWRVG